MDFDESNIHWFCQIGNLYVEYSTTVDHNLKVV